MLSKRLTDIFFKPLIKQYLKFDTTFRYKNLKGNNQTRETSDIFRQINSDEYIYVSNYNYMSQTGFNFTFEKFKDQDTDVLIQIANSEYLSPPIVSSLAIHPNQK